MPVLTLWQDCEAILVANTDSMLEGRFPSKQFYSWIKEVSDTKSASAVWQVVKHNYKRYLSVPTVQLIETHFASLISVSDLLFYVISSVYLKLPPWRELRKHRKRLKSQQPLR